LRDYVEQAIAAGKKPMEAYREVAEKFEIHTQTAKRIVRCERRGETVARFKRVKSAAA
jgi:hypothetical protein